MRVCLAVLVASCLATVGAVAAPAGSAATAATPGVIKLILQPKQIGKNFLASIPSDGRGVKAQVTLNLCGEGYASEKLRQNRLQANYAEPGGKVGLSNEVVTYRAGGAAQALREVTQRALHCPRNPIPSAGPGSLNLKFVISTINDTHLLPGYLAVRVVTSGVVKGKHVVQTSYAIYQRRGNVLSGVYSYGPPTKKQLSLVLRAAEQSAANLRRGATGGGGPTGPIA